ncbi:MAG: hypothetical protein LBU58_04345, partial [Clostridiales bacterium]|nr:hypothetical protein [Clostridiales bacterium]
YHPLGQRGIGLTSASGFGYAPDALDFVAYLQSANSETLLLPQCETAECLKNIEEIASVEGIDGIFIGPMDLSAALGKTGQFDTPEFAAALAKVQKACKEAGKYCFIYGLNAQSASTLFAQGMDSVAVSLDAVVYVEAYKRLLAEIKR